MLPKSQQGDKPNHGRPNLAFCVLYYGLFLLGSALMIGILYLGAI